MVVVAKKGTIKNVLKKRMKNTKTDEMTLNKVEIIWAEKTGLNLIHLVNQMQEQNMVLHDIVCICLF